jgi:hypothetical protein
VKQITKFQADDGTEFRTPNEAMAHDALCVEVAALVAKLHARPDDGCNFSNGHGFIRQDKDAVLAVQRGLVAIARRYFGSDEIYERHFRYSEEAEKPTGHTFVGRLIDDGCPAPVTRAWQRLMCIGEDFREWGQPYYANHPNEAEQIDRTPPNGTG